MLFVLIGAEPHTEWLAGCLQRDADGFVVTGHDLDRTDWRLERDPMRLETSMPGVFAVGEGAIAVTSIHDYLAAPADIEFEDADAAAGP